MNWSTMFPASAALLTVGLLAAAPSASAVSLGFTPTRSFFAADGSDQTLTIDFTLSGVTNSDDVVRSWDLLLAYNPAVLSYKSSSAGTALDSTYAITLFDSPPATSAFNYATDYVPGTNPPGSHINTATIAGYMLGTPAALSGGYYPGSLRFTETTLVDDQDETDFLNDLLAKQSLNPVLFSVTFDVNTDAIGKSAIVLLDDTNFLNVPAGKEFFDVKLGPDQEIGYFNMTSSSDWDVKVPVPGTLALLGFGLIGLARRRARC